MESATPVQPINPYQDLDGVISNLSRFKIIESTLREGEQFASAFFTTEMKVKIAKLLDEFGVDYIELTSPVASEQSRKDCEIICKLGLKAKILTHVRCNLEDAQVAVETGVDGLDVVIGTSHFLREHSHGKSMAQITTAAIEVIEFVKSKGLEIRFSSEDSFRSDLVDLLSLYQAVNRVGVTRVGVADTVGCASPRQVYKLVSTLRGVVSCDIETHFHNDTGCAIANAYCALEAGATHVDTSVLGIGERNGITPLGGFIGRMIVTAPEYVKSKYNLKILKDIENLVADCVEVNIPFNNYITGACAFTHKAGIHAKAILNNPSTYEILNPADFGLNRYIHFTSRLTGWNAVKARFIQLGIPASDERIKECTTKLKALADIRPVGMDDCDAIIRSYHMASGNTHEPYAVNGKQIEARAEENVHIAENGGKIENLNSVQEPANLKGIDSVEEPATTGSANTFEVPAITESANTSEVPTKNENGEQVANGGDKAHSNVVEKAHHIIGNLLHHRN